MNTTATDYIVLREILQILPETGLQGFPEAMTMLYDLARSVFGERLAVLRRLCSRAGAYRRARVAERYPVM